MERGGGGIEYQGRLRTWGEGSKNRGKVVTFFMDGPLVLSKCHQCINVIGLSLLLFHQAVILKEGQYNLWFLTKTETLKFGYSEKKTHKSLAFHFLFDVSNYKWKMGQIFVAFSKYLNFN